MPLLSFIAHKNTRNSNRHKQTPTVSTNWIIVGNEKCHYSFGECILKLVNANNMPKFQQLVTYRFSSFSCHFRFEFICIYAGVHVISPPTHLRPYRNIGNFDAFQSQVSGKMASNEQYTYIFTDNFLVIIRNVILV